MPQDRRRAEITRFKKDPACRLFLSSESGGVGLNLQVADTVVNLDLPWNPAKLEQRIARAWRKHQKRPVSVVNLVTEDSIEHRMLFLLEQKQGLADGVLDGVGSLEHIRMPSGRGAFLERMESMMADTVRTAEEAKARDPAMVLRDALVERHGVGLLTLLAPGGPGDTPLVAVLDGAPSVLEKERQLLKEGNIAVEVLDRQTYETLRRLEATGVLRFTGGETDELHRSPRLDDDGLGMRLEQVRELVAESDRKLRMAALLAGGDFEAESRAPAGEAVTIALRALAVAAGKDDPRDDGEVDDLTDRLYEESVLPLDLKRGIETAQTQGSALAVAGKLLAHVRTVLEDVAGGSAAAEWTDGADDIMVVGAMA